MQFRLFLSFILLILTFSSCNTNDVLDGNYEIKGSDSELALIQYMIDQSQKNGVRAKFSVTGGGSLSGIESFIQKKVDVANASCLMSEKEMLQARKIGKNPVPVIIASDAIAIIIHPEILVDSLSIFQVRDILVGRISNWKEVGGQDAVIELFGRDASSGTREYLRRNFINGELSSNIQELPSSKDVISSVMQTKNSIGYVSIGNVRHEEIKQSDIKVLSIYSKDSKALSPYDEAAIMSGDYPLNRPLYQYYNGWPSNELLKFLQFELSDRGQQILQSYGYFPITPAYKRLNSLTEESAYFK